MLVVELVEDVLFVTGADCSTEPEVSPSTLLSPSSIDASLGYSKVRVAVSSNCIRC